MLEWSPKGNLIAAASKYTSNSNETWWLYIVDSRTGAGVAQIPVQPGQSTWNALTALTWSPDESELALANRSGEVVTVRLSDHAFTPVRIPKEERICNGLAWHPFEKKLAASLQWGAREVIDLSSGQVKHAAKRGLSYGGRVAWSPSGNLLAVTEHDQGEIRILNAELAIKRTIMGVGRASAIQWKDNNTLISLSPDRDICVWDVSTGEPLESLRVHSRPATTFVFDSITNKILTRSERGLHVASIEEATAEFQARDINGTSTLRPQLQAEASPSTLDLLRSGRVEVHRIRWSPSGRHLLLNEAYLKDGTTWHWDSFWSSNGLNRIGSLGQYSIDGGEWEPCFRQLTFFASANNHSPIDSIEGYIFLYDFDAQRLAYLGKGKQRDVFSDKDISLPISRQLRNRRWSVHPSQKLIAEAEQFSTEPVMVRVADGSQLVCELSEHKGRVTDVDWSPDGMRIVTSGDDGAIRVCDASSGRQLLSLSADQDSSFTSVAWSPDGLQLAASTTEGRFYIWGSSAMNHPSPDATILETGVIQKTLLRIYPDKPSSRYPVERLGWKHHVVELQRLLEPYQWKAGTVRPDAEFDAMVAGTKSKSRRGFVEAMIYLVEADDNQNSTDWLAERLVESLNSEVAENSQTLEAWKDLVTANLVIANLDRDGSRLSYWEDAAVGLVKVIELAPDDEVAKSRLSHIVSDRFSSPESVQRLVEALSRQIVALDSDVQRIGLKQQRATLLLKLNRLEEYQADVISILESLPDDSDEINQRSWQIVADASCAVRFYDLVANCASHLKRHLSAQPNNGAALNSLGVARYRLGEYEQAIADLLRSEELMDGNDAFNLFFIAMSQWQLGKREDALKTLDEAISWTKEHAANDLKLHGFRREAQRLMADIEPLQLLSRELAEENWQAALDRLAEALELLERPAFDDPRGLKSDVLLDVAREANDVAMRHVRNWTVAAEATSKLHQLLSLRGQVPSILDRHRLTMLLVAADQLDQAKEHVGNMLDEIDLKETDSQTMRMVAHSAMTVRELSDEATRKALQFAENAAERDPNHEWSKLILGLAQLRGNHWDSAITNLEAAAKIWQNASPQRAMILAGLAIAHFHQGDREAGAAALQAAKDSLAPSLAPEVQISSHDVLGAMSLVAEATNAEKTR